MKVSYKPLWKLLIDKEMKPSELYRLSGISVGTASKLRNGDSVNMEVLWRICQVLDCNIGDIVEFIK